MKFEFVNFLDVFLYKGELFVKSLNPSSSAHKSLGAVSMKDLHITNFASNVEVEVLYNLKNLLTKAL